MSDIKEKWERFYELADQLLEAEPWQSFDDGQLICLHHPDLEQPVFVNILGNAGTTYGLVFYDGLEGLNDYNLVRAGTDMNLPATYSLFQQTCECLYFGKEDEVPDDQYDYYHVSEYDFSDSEYGIPYLLSLKKGYFPWTPAKEEIDYVNFCLEKFLDVLDEVFISDLWGYGARHGFCLCEWLDNEEEWELSYPPLFSEDYSADMEAPSKEEILARTRNAKHNYSSYEIDVYYANFHIDDPSLPRPAAAPFLLVADAGTGMIIDQKLLEPGEDISYEMNNILLKAAERYGIPKEVCVRSILFADMLEFTVPLLKCEINIYPTLAVIDDLTVMIENGMFSPEKKFYS